MRRTWSRIGGLVVALVVAGAACGVPTDGDPRALDPEDLPPGLGPPEPTPTVDQAEPTGVDIDLFLIGTNDRLEPVKQEVPLPVDTKTVLETLVGSADAEAFQDLLEDRQLRSAIPTDTVVVDAVVDEAGILIVNLGPEGLVLIEEETQTLQAIAQIVYTMTALESIDGILIQVEGELRPLPTDGDPTEGNRPVTREDYKSLA